MNQHLQSQNLYCSLKMSSPLNRQEGSSFSTNDQFSSYFNSSSKVEKCIPKPDFSSIEKKETTLEFKEPGSYKKQKILFPQTPIKSQRKSFSTTPGNFGKELFPTNGIQEQHFSACRKLNFNCSSSSEEDSVEPKEEKKVSKFPLGLYGLTPQFLECLEEKDEENLGCSSKNVHANIDSMKIFSNDNAIDPNDQMCVDSSCSSYIGSKNVFERSGKFDCEYYITKILSEKKARKVYKCLHKNNKRLCIIRKVKSLQYNQHIQTIQALIREMTNNTKSAFARFCTNYLDSWEENNTDSNKSITALDNTNNSSFYVYEKYYQNGDLLDYLSRLDNEGFSWTIQFYWDMIFEMLCGLQFLHECGFVHFDVQPANFYVESNGDIKLGGLSHSKAYQNLIELFLNKNTSKLSIDDLFGGDSIYLAPEIFNRSTLSEIDFKCDVFSLGLSLLEIIGKINLPQNGTLWRTIRTPGFKLNQTFFSQWNDNYIPFANLIQKMIAVDVKQRPTIVELLNDSINFPELTSRLKSLMSNSYTKTSINELLYHLMQENDEETKLINVQAQGNMQLLQAKRSSSTNTFDFLKKITTQ